MGWLITLNMEHTIYNKAISDLQSLANTERAQHAQRYFKTGPGEYGENDVFIGCSVPDQRKVAATHYKEISLQETEMLLQSKIHEHRLTALFILVYKFEKSKDQALKTEIACLYIHNLKYVNNWDLTDSSASKILGPWLYNKDLSLLYDFAQSDDLWKQRIAIVTTGYFISKGQLSPTFDLVLVFMHHPHDLIHKGVGWMLREAGQKDMSKLLVFITQYYHQMPRTMLRYAIERFPEELRQQYLKGLV